MDASNSDKLKVPGFYELTTRPIRPIKNAVSFVTVKDFNCL